MIKNKSFQKITSNALLISGLVWVGLALFAACSSNPSDSQQPQDNYPSEHLSFSQHIRPIFLQDCAAIGVCHQIGTRAGGLDLESDPPTFQGDHGLVVVPFSAQNSLLYRVLFQDEDGVRRMPPNQSALSDAKITAIGTWIDEGANTAN